MGKLINALKNLGAKLTGGNIESKKLVDVINETADNYKGGGETPHLYEITVQMGDNALISLRSLSKVAITNLMNITDETVITDEIWNELLNLKDNLFCTSLQTISDTALLGGSGIMFFEEEGEINEISIYAYINYPDMQSNYYVGDNIEESSIAIRKVENGYEVYCNGIRTPRNIICKQIF